MNWARLASLVLSDADRGTLAQWLRDRLAHFVDHVPDASGIRAQGVAALDDFRTGWTRITELVQERVAEKHMDPDSWKGLILAVHRVAAAEFAARPVALEGASRALTRLLGYFQGSFDMYRGSLRAQSPPT